MEGSIAGVVDMQFEHGSYMYRPTAIDCQNVTATSSSRSVAHRRRHRHHRRCDQ